MLSLPVLQRVRFSRMLCRHRSEYAILACMCLESLRSLEARMNGAADAEALFGVLLDALHESQVCPRW